MVLAERRGTYMNGDLALPPPTSPEVFGNISFKGKNNNT